MPREKNPCGKTRKVDKPYEIWKGVNPMMGDIEYRVLKKYQSPSNENTNPYARWFVAAKSAYTFGQWELGDTYIKDITLYCQRVDV